MCFHLATGRERIRTQYKQEYQRDALANHTQLAKDMRAALAEPGVPMSDMLRSSMRDYLSKTQERAKWLECGELIAHLLGKGRKGHAEKDGHPLLQVRIIPCA